MTDLAMRRPGLLIGLAVAAVGLLGVLGISVEDRLAQTSLRIEGSESARGEELEERSFGNSVPVAILLEGPAEELDRQGPRLVRELRALGGVRTLSPWDRGVNLDGLRPDPDAALIVADFDRPDEQATEVVVPRTRRLAEETVEPPVSSHLSGYAVIGKGLEEESIEATRQAELVAVPALLVVLLFVFRSPIAAAIPLLIGGATVLAGRGLIALLAELIEVDALAVSVASMMGLALGVDYALLLVSRFREELAGGSQARGAARTTANTAGRTIVFAGATVAVAMGVAVLTAPGDLLVSISASVVLVVLLAVAIATATAPAILLLLGANVNRWTIGAGAAAGAAAGAGVTGWIRRALREPVVAAIAVLGILFVLTAPAVALETGPPNVDQLPRDNPVRSDFERIEERIGPGWTAPFRVVATAGEGPVTSGKRMRTLERWQRQITEAESVQAVVGPGQVAERLEPLRSVSDQADRADRRLARAERGLEDLSGGLDRAVSGINELRGGLLEAAAGAGELASGSARAAAGAAELAAGLEQAAAGSDRALGALRALRDGAEQLAAGARRARSGAEELRQGIQTARQRAADRLQSGAERLAEGLESGARELERLRQPAQTAEAELEQAFRALRDMTVGKADPQYAQAFESVVRASAAVSGREPTTGAAVQPGYDGIDAELAAAVAQLREAADGADRLVEGIERLVGGLGRLRDGADRLTHGLERLRDGAAQLATVPERLIAGSRRLAEGLARLSAGARRLADGVAGLRAGGDELESGLSSGYERSAPLQSGLARARDRLEPFQARLTTQQRRLDRLERNSPGLFDSGYFFLAALDGAPKAERRQVAEAVSVEQGGGAARFLIIPDSAPNTTEIEELRDQLDAKTDELASAFDGQAAVTGGAAQIADYDRITKSRLPLLVAALAIVTYLFLIPILRALLLPLIAVVLNLMTVGAAFGVLTFLYQVLPGQPLGGAGYIEAVTAAGIFGIVFALSIDYEVFLLTRMREGYLLSGDNDQAIVYGLERTARVITGAAAIMGAVFLAFATTEVASIQQFGIGLTVAVLLDATVVRLILLPALMRLFGSATWWMPRWLDRLLPDLDPEPSAPEPLS